jgi:hypothetical protein
MPTLTLDEGWMSLVATTHDTQRGNRHGCCSCPAGLHLSEPVFDREANLALWLGIGVAAERLWHRDLAGRGANCGYQYEHERTRGVGGCGKKDPQSITIYAYSQPPGFSLVINGQKGRDGLALDDMQHCE